MPARETGPFGEGRPFEEEPGWAGRGLGAEGQKGSMQEELYRQQAAEAAARMGESRGYQEEALGGYRDLMTDPSKSVAQQQLRAGLEQNLQQQVAAQAAARGGSMAGAQQLAAGQAAGLGAQMNQQAAQLRAQEYAAAVGGMGQLGTQMAGQDIQQQLGLGGLGQQYWQGGLDWESQQREMREEEKQGRWGRGRDIVMGGLEGVGSIIGGAFGSDVRMKENIRPLDEGTAVRGERGAEIDALANRIAAQTRQPYAVTERERAQEEALALIEGIEDPDRQNLATVDPWAAESGRGYVGSGAVAAPGRSADPFDRTMAQRAGERASGWRRAGDVSLAEATPADLAAARDARIAGALGNVGAYEYNYKPGMGPEGRRTGVMAQDLAAEPALAGAVVETPEGLGVDTAKASSAALAASASQQREIDKLKEELEEERKRGSWGGRKKRSRREQQEWLQSQKGAAKFGGGLGILMGGD